MPKVQAKPPEALRPFLFHGINLNWEKAVRDKEENASGDCPLCGRDDKFGVNLETGQYKCFKCSESGNATVFLRWLHEQSIAATNEYNPLTVDRKLLNGAALIQWEVCKSTLTDDWLIPGYSLDGKVCQLYRYMKNGDRMATMPTPTIGHYLQGLGAWKPDNLIVFICEGWSDGVALHEVMAQCKQTDDGWFPTSNYEASMLADANVVAAPTCSTFHESWCSLFSGKVVNLLFDNDHPGTNKQTGKPTPPGGLAGMQRIARMLLTYKEPPESIQFLEWGKEGYNLELKSGFDIRDYVTTK